ncbi:MAG: phage tail protein [Verrucomicrobia bacterium]|nr:phage tail protein [Verrucomicrobiota bacterium]
MAEPFIGQIIPCAFNFAPRGYALCNGQLLTIQSNTALFSLLGTYYGGDGRTTFGLPDLRGRITIHQNQTTYVIGQTGGEETHSLLLTEMPQHNHVLNATNAVATAHTPNGNFLAATTRADAAHYAASSDGSTLAATTVAIAGGSQPHNNLPPYTVVNYCIATVGIFPSRN